MNLRTTVRHGMFRPVLLIAGMIAMIAGAGAQEAKYSIAVIPKGTTHDFWQAVHAGAVKAEQELADVSIVWQGPVREDDRNSQVTLVQNHVIAGRSAIVLAPLDSRALVNPVRMAQGRQIPVVIIDSDIEREVVEPVSFVATDNRKGGYLGGKHLAELLGGEGNVVLLRYQVGSASTEAREQGFMEAMAESPGIEVISENQYAGATKQTALEKAGSLLTALSDQQIDGIFCPNESSTFGMLRALQDRGMAGKVKFVGFDASPKLLEALEGGEIDGLVVQNPFKMGYEGVKAAYAALEGEAVAARIDTGVYVVTAENIEDEAIAEVINPPIDKYLNPEKYEAEQAAKAAAATQPAAD